MIELSHVSKYYSLSRGVKKIVLDDISYTFKPGVNMGILGLNGAGKTTLSGKLALMLKTKKRKNKRK